MAAIRRYRAAIGFPADDAVGKPVDPQPDAPSRQGIPDPISPLSQTDGPRDQGRPDFSRWAHHDSACAKWGPVWEWPRHLHRDIACTCGLDAARAVADLVSPEPVPEQARPEQESDAIIVCELVVGMLSDEAVDAALEDLGYPMTLNGLRRVLQCRAEREAGRRALQVWTNQPRAASVESLVGARASDDHQPDHPAITTKDKEPHS